MAFWLPQNIQRRLLLYVLQQITLFSNVDVSKLDVSLGSHSKFTFRDVDLNVDDVNIPGFSVNSGSIGNLRIGLTVSGDVSVHGDDINFVLSMTNNDDIAELNAFSLAKSIHDLTTSMIQFNPKSNLGGNAKFDNDSGNDSNDSNNGNENVIFDDYNDDDDNARVDDLEFDDAVSSTTESEDGTTDSNVPSSRLNSMQQRVIAVAIAKLKIELHNLKFIVKLGDDIDSNYFHVTIKKIEMSTTEKNSRIFSVKDLHVNYCTAATTDDINVATNMEESLYFSQVDTGSIYMSAVENTDDILNNKQNTGFVKQELVSMGNINFSLKGLSSLDDLSVSDINISIDFIDVSIPVLLQIKDDIIFKLIRSWIKKPTDIKGDLRNSPAYKRFQKELAYPDGQFQCTTTVDIMKIKLNSNNQLLLKNISSIFEGARYSLSIQDVDLEGLDSYWKTEPENIFNVSVTDNEISYSIGNSKLVLSVHDISNLLILLPHLQEYQDFVMSKVYGKIHTRNVQDTQKRTIDITWGGLEIELLNPKKTLSIIIPSLTIDSMSSNLVVKQVTLVENNLENDLIEPKNRADIFDMNIDLSGHRMKSKSFDEHFSKKFIFTNLLVNVSSVRITLDIPCLLFANEIIEEITSIIKHGSNNTGYTSNSVGSGKKMVKMSVSTIMNNKALLAQFVICVKEFHLRILDIPPSSFGDIYFNLSDILVSITRDDLLLVNAYEPNITRSLNSTLYEPLFQGITYHNSEKSKVYLCRNRQGKMKLRCSQTITYYYATWLRFFREASSDGNTNSIPVNDNKSEGRIDIQISDSIIILQPYRINPALAIYCGTLAMTYNLDDRTTNLNIRNGKLFMIDTFENKIPSKVAANNAVELLVKEGFSSVGRIEDISLILKNTTTTKVIQMHIGYIVLSMCADSFHTFTQLCMDLKFPETFPDEEKYELAPKEDVNVFDSVSDYEFTSSTLANTNRQYLEDNSDTGSLHIVDSFLDEVDDVDDLVSPLPLISSSHETSETSSSTANIPINLKEEYIDAPRPRSNSSNSLEENDVIFTLKIDIEKLEMKLFDGFDWKYTRKFLSKAINDLEDEVDLSPITDSSTERPIAKTSLFDSICISSDQKEIGKLKETITEQIQGERQRSLKNKANLHPSKHFKALILTESISMQIKLHENICEDREKSEGKSNSLVDVEGDIGIFEVIDNVPTSTWNKFVTLLKREAWPKKEPMAKFSFSLIRPINYLQAIEAIIDIKLAPLRIHADQDMVDFLLRFVQFKDDRFELIDDYPEILFIQKFKINTVKLRIDYKPKKTDNGLYSGHIMDIMNLFVLDESKLSLKGVVLYGINGFTELGEQLIKVWGSDVASKQLFSILQGFSPVKSFVSIGEGAQAFITVLLAEYRKDKNITRSVKKGGNIFIKTTTGDFIKLSTKLAIGTQSLLENTEGMLGGIGAKGRVESILQENSKLLDLDALFQEDQLLAGKNPKVHNKPPSAVVIDTAVREEDGKPRVVSLYADQPLDVHEGLEEAYQALEKHLHIAYDTIWKTNQELKGMEGGGAKAAAITIARAAPVAIIRPMIGATEAIAKTLQGLYNQWDKTRVEDLNDKYKKKPK